MTENYQYPIMRVTKNVCFSENEWDALQQLASHFTESRPADSQHPHEPRRNKISRSGVIRILIRREITRIFEDAQEKNLK